MLRLRSLRKYFAHSFDVPPVAKSHSEIIPNVSIIVCARNEENQIKENIPLILQQDYPKDNWELIVVNDASTDLTSEILESFDKAHPHLQIVSVDKNDERLFPGKKHALHRGLEAAKFNIVLLTDADCHPASNYWLKEMAQATTNTKKPVILGYGAYKTSPGFLNKMVQWETIQTCILYAGMCLADKPYMGVGRNLLYNKQLYFKALLDKEFKEKYKTLPSGDDDLLVGKIANRKNTAICLSKRAHTISQPPKSFGEWFRQKSRHVSTGKYYTTNTKIILGSAALSQGLFWLLWLFIALQLLLLPENTTTTKFTLFSVGLLAGILRIGIYWLNAQKWYTVLGTRKLTYYYPLSEICLSIFQLIISPYIFWKNKKKWK